jgi:hypothetical protein
MKQYKKFKSSCSEPSSKPTRLEALHCFTSSNLLRPFAEASIPATKEHPPGIALFRIHAPPTITFIPNL